MTAISRLTASEAYVPALRRSESAVTSKLDGLDLPDEVRHARRVPPGAATDRLVIATDSRMPRISTYCTTPYGRPPGGGRRPPSGQAKIHKHKQHPLLLPLVFADLCLPSRAQRGREARCGRVEQVLNRVGQWPEGAVERLVHRHDAIGAKAVHDHSAAGRGEAPVPVGAGQQPYAAIPARSSGG